YKVAADTHAEDYDDRFHVFAPNEISLDPDNGFAAGDENGAASPDFQFGLGDFNFRQLRSNAVLRWEYKPGSTMFVIWSHDQTDNDADGRFGTGGLSRGLSGLFGAPSDDVVMLKVNYWV